MSKLPHPVWFFNDAWYKKKLMECQNQIFYVVSIDDLIASKMAAGREIDLDDAKLLKANHKKNDQ